MSSKDTEKKRQYIQFAVEPEVFRQLERVKSKKEASLGVKLSWTNFFRMYLKELKESEGA